MKACLYARVSSDSQDANNQVLAMKSWAKQRGFEVVATYQESESAWRAGHQLELKHLIADARLHKFELVLVWALDRLSREGSAAILNIINTLAVYKVKVISYQEPWTETPGEIGELLYAIAGWVARMESQRRSERTLAGLNRAIREGKRLGRPKGSRDKGKRRRTGYLLRYVDQTKVRQ